jgi:membrane dipeptidase
VFELPLGEHNNTIAKVDANLAPQTPLVFTGTIPDEFWMNTDQLAKVIDYGVNLVGEDHIALGSDFDGWPELSRDMRDISDLPQITVELLKLGYSEQRIRKILGLNWLRVIREVSGG